MGRCRSLYALCVIVALWTSGCGQKLYRAETRLEADGRVSRAIYQPADDTPLDARAAEVWTKTTYAAEIRPENWSGSIRDLPAAAADKDHPYFAAWGEFKSPEKVPATYRKPAPPGLPDGKLALDYTRDDYVLVIAHRWSETLTDIVTLDDMHRSRRQFLEVVIPLVSKCLEKALGPDYETDALVAWLESTGRDWFVELTDAFFEAGARNQLPPNDEWKQTLADVCGRYGLKLRDEQGALLDEDRARASVAAFAEQVLRQRLRRRDGREVPQSVFDDLLEWVNLKDPAATQNPRLARLDGLAQQVIAQQFGSQQKFEELVSPLAVRMLGLYRVEVLGPPRAFHYALEMPGPVVESNGLLVADNRVLWKFEAVQAYPFGYAMRAVALAPELAVQRELVGGEPIATREAMLEFVEAVSADFLLRETLRKCVKARSTDPLFEARAQVAAERGDTQPFDTVIRLLKRSDSGR
jgi:hypothetical protein